MLFVGLMTQSNRSGCSGRIMTARHRLCKALLISAMNLELDELQRRSNLSCYSATLTLLIIGVNNLCPMRSDDLE